MSKVLATPSELGWLAGLLEGEGCFSLNTSNNRKYVRFVIASVDKDVLDRVSQLIGRTSVNKMKKYKPHHKDTWRLTVSGELAAAWMEAVLPLMGVRRRQQIEHALRERTVYE